MTREELIEVMARAQCVDGGFDPDERMPNDGPRWGYYVPGVSAALTAIEAAGVRLVPVEATEEMAERGDDRIRAWIPMPTYKGDYKEPLEDVYRAMLAASPYAKEKPK